MMSGISTETLLASIHYSGLHTLAGERSYQRSKQYFITNKVSKLHFNCSTVSATVSGTQLYRVTLKIKEEWFAYGCNCPVGQTEASCKHVVALALSVLKEAGIDPLDENFENTRPSGKLTRKISA